MSHPDLETLIAADRPVPRPAFTAELDARVAAGFPRPARAGRAWRLPRLTLAPALAGAVALVVAVVVASSLHSANHAGTGTGPASVVPASSSAGTGTATEAAPPAAADSAPAMRSAAPSPSPFRGRQVERATSLTLGVRPRRMQATAQRVYGVVGAFGGIVDASTVTSGGAGSGATFALRIPAARLGPAVSRLAALGRVRSQTGTSTDVTGAFVSARDRLNAAVAERTGLLRALTKAVTTTAIDALKQRLRIAEARISSARADLRRLHGRVDYARVALQLEPTGPVPVHHGHGGGAYTPRDALRDAGRILEGAAAVAVVVLALLVPLGILGGAAGFGGRRLRRRRREAALDSR